MHLGLGHVSVTSDGPPYGRPHARAIPMTPGPSQPEEGVRAFLDFERGRSTLLLT
jgi:hypothetical protein